MAPYAARLHRHLRRLIGEESPRDHEFGSLAVEKFDEQRIDGPARERSAQGKRERAGLLAKQIPSVVRSL